jgi:hypothetical protein
MYLASRTTVLGVFLSKLVPVVVLVSVVFVDVVLLLGTVVVVGLGAVVVKLLVAVPLSTEVLLLTPDPLDETHRPLVLVGTADTADTATRRARKTERMVRKWGVRSGE